MSAPSFSLNLEFFLPAKAQGGYCDPCKKQSKHKGLVRRENINLGSYDCELCLLQKEERLRHLFFKYPFAKKIVGIK
jgi:hypothetical protein